MALEYSNPILDILTAEEAEPDWLIPNLLLRGTLTCLAGEPAAGKSYISYTMALAAASGSPALSGLVPAGPPRTCLYFDQENAEQERNKYLTRSYNGLTDLNGTEPDLVQLVDHFIPVHMRLGGEDWFDVAAEFIEHFCPEWMVFDTAASVFNIADENSNAEAAQVVKKIRQLMAMGNPTISALVLKHAKTQTEKGGRRRMRGATMWQSLADNVMFQVRHVGRPKKGLHLTRLEPDKTRAFGLPQTIYITPSYTDDRKSGLMLEASYVASREHRKDVEDADDDDDDYDRRRARRKKGIR